MWGAGRPANVDSTEELTFMVDRNIVNKLGLSEQQIDQQVGEMFSDEESRYLEQALETRVDSRLPGTILKGTIVSQIGNDVMVEVGLKSEGVVDAAEFGSPEEITPGTEIEVLLEDTDSESGLILLSKRKADAIRGWEMIINTKKEGDAVTGKVIRRIKGGLLVDIGVPVFCPPRKLILENRAISADSSAEMWTARFLRSMLRAETLSYQGASSSKKIAAQAKKRFCLKLRSVSCEKAW